MNIKMSIDNWNEDSMLSRAGYAADGTQSVTRRVVCIDRAINGQLASALEASRHLRWLIDDRGKQCARARIIWQDDIEYIARLINGGKLNADREQVRAVVNYQLQQQTNHDYQYRDIFAGRKSGDRSSSKTEENGL